MTQRTFLSAVLAIAVLAMGGHMVLDRTAAAAKDETGTATPGAGLTEYVDISVASRKKGAAKKMNDLHRARFAQGWSVIDVEPYVENGDLQGFFVTYVGRD